MPRYDYECMVCATVVEAHRSIAERHTHAPSCHGRPMSIAIGAGPATHVFKPMWAEHLDSEPIWITSKRQYKEEARKRGKIVVDLL